jgi:hypothetical protein
MEGRSIQWVDDPKEVGMIVLRELRLFGQEAVARKGAPQRLLHQPARRQVSGCNKIISAFEPDRVSAASFAQVPHQNVP